MRNAMVHRLVIAALTLALWLAAVPARADTYEVNDVRVDVTGDTAAKARDTALMQAQRKAFTRLLDRLTLFEDRENLPLLDESEIAALIRDFEVAGEKTSAVRYIGRINVHFKRQEVRALLQDYGLAFAETMSRPVLVLPVYRGAGPPVLWEDPNPWRGAWNAQPDSDSLVPVILPPGDLSDVRTIVAHQALTGDQAALMAIAGNYGAASVLVPFARLEVDPQSGRLLLAVYVSRFGAAGQEQGFARSFAALEGEDTGALLSRAAAEISRSLQDDWKRDNLVRFGAQGVTEVTVPIAGLGGWLVIRRKLDGISVVRETEVLLLSRDKVRLALHHIGDVDQLVLALKQADLHLEWDGLEWVLGTTARSAVRR